MVSGFNRCLASAVFTIDILGQKPHEGYMTFWRPTGRSLWNHCDACHGMNFHPVRVKGVLHIGSYYANVRAHCRDLDLILECPARRLGVRLSHREPAYDFEHQVATLVTHISGVQRMLKLGVDVEPSVRFSILLVADPIAPFATAGIHNGSGHSYALLIHDEPLRMVDMIP
jgi:hypothetical protein